MRYSGNFDSFRVEEQVAFCASMSAQRTTLEHLLTDDLAGLKLGVFVRVLTSFKLDDLFRFSGDVLPEETGVGFEALEVLLCRFLLSEPVLVVCEVT